MTRKKGYCLIEYRKEDGSDFRALLHGQPIWSSARRPGGDRAPVAAPQASQQLKPIDTVLDDATRRKHCDVLPISCPPRGLSRVQAAAYIGVSPTLFDEMVKDGRMPGPKHANSRRIWDRLQIDAAFSALPEEEEVNPWDQR